MSNVDKHPAGAVGWFDLMTSDPEAARRFYGELFGWSFDIGPAELGHYAMCRLRDRNVCGLGPVPPGNPMPPAWSVYFITDDLDRTLMRVRELGGNVVVDAMDIPEAGRMAVAADATGAVFGMWQGTQHQGAQVIEEPGAMAWCEVNTRDGAKASAFYAKVFDLEVKQLEAPGMDYKTLHTGDKTVGGVLQMDKHWPESVPPHWMAYFAVASTDASCARVTELGGKVCVPAFDTPYGRISVVEDPQGATFSIVQPPAKAA
jgi:predicted enzyme related to lactoylglutathione lyase